MLFMIKHTKAKTAQELRDIFPDDRSGIREIGLIPLVAVIAVEINRWTLKLRHMDEGLRLKIIDLDTFLVAFIIPMVREMSTQS